MTRHERRVIECVREVVRLRRETDRRGDSEAMFALRRKAFAALWDAYADYERVNTCEK